MKRTTLIIVFLFAITGAFAQKGKVTAALSYQKEGDLERAVRAIDETVDANNPKAESSVNWANAWDARGDIYQAVAKSNDPKIKSLSADPIKVAYDSYMKAIQLDEKNKLGKSMQIKLTVFAADLQNKAIEAYNAENYEKAMNLFEQVLEIEKTPAYKGDDMAAIDTSLIYNIGLTAEKAKLWDKAIKYYKDAAQYKYGGAATYRDIFKVYIQKNDSANALATLKDGLNIYEGSNVLLPEVINIYIAKKEAAEAMKYLDMAIQKEASNPSYYFAKGYLYEKMEKIDDAIKSYEKAIALKNDYFDAYYNIGVLIFNEGVKQWDVAIAVPSNQTAKYEEEKAKADVEFKKALPYMEKASEINPTDKATLESLKTIYYRLNMMDKYNQITEKLKNI